jgi:predicted lipoprotein with Yx(FWY)xxD motif
MSSKTLRLPWRATLLVLSGLTLIVASACTAARAGAPAGATTTAAPTGSASAVTVMTKTGPKGTYLVDGQGKSLYLFVPDTNGSSTCYGPCAAAWPPLTVTATPKAGSGVNAAMLATTNRTDGTKQVTYAGHPLYYWTGDTHPGDTTGQGLNNLGGLWWLVAPSGTAITG